MVVHPIRLAPTSGSREGTVSSEDPKDQDQASQSPQSNGGVLPKAMLGSVSGPSTVQSHLHSKEA